MLSLIWKTIDPLYWIELSNSLCITNDCCFVFAKASITTFVCIVRKPFWHRTHWSFIIVLILKKDHSVVIFQTAAKLSILYTGLWSNTGMIISHKSADINSLYSQYDIMLSVIKLAISFWSFTVHMCCMWINRCLASEQRRTYGI